MEDCTSSKVGIKWNEENLKHRGLGFGYFRLPRQSRKKKEDQIKLRLVVSVSSST